MKFNYPVHGMHTQTIEEALHTFQTDAQKGLSKAEVLKRTEAFGLNIYASQRQKSIWILVIHQFKSAIVYLLIFGAVVSIFYKDFLEAAAIAAVIFINALIGFLMELQARSTMIALKEMDVILSKVIRDGEITEIPSENLTPGDIVLLIAGDVVPGDGRLLEAIHLQCDESSLTGESLPSEKNTAKLPEGTVPGDRINMVFKGTSVINGKGKAVITGISGNTELGIITSLVAQSVETTTPLDKKINSLSQKLIWVTIGMTAIFAVAGIIQGKKLLLIIETSIALAVAAIPEGLPIVSTVALAYGMLLMAKRNAIVKKLSSVETLGSTNVILTDKTGTLTENKITVETISFPEVNMHVTIDNNILHFEKSQINKSVENLEKLKMIGALCNDAVEQEENDRLVQKGDPVEIALLHLANTSGSTVAAYKNQYERIAEVPFSSETKMMATIHKSGKSVFVAAKGSVEHLLEKCSHIQFGPLIKVISENDNRNILSESDKMARDGLRVLAFAYKSTDEITSENYLSDLVYVSMIGFLDPPRLDIKDAISSCRNAGIKIVMITGDHPMTALNIARKTGLIDEQEQHVIVGKDIPAEPSLSREWTDKILATAVFARVTPKQKLEIADIYQKAGNIVAMTGDGVNDAPALKKADIGIAMGLSGTQVAKETADIILKDDSFTTIALAVSEGRTIFSNIKKFVLYLVSCNLSEILCVTILGFIAPSSTLLPLQILFLNMVTDIFPALALGVGKSFTAVMQKPPKDPGNDIISNSNWGAIVLYASLITLSVIFAVLYCIATMPADFNIINNVAFLTLAFAQLFHVFNMASSDSGLIVNEITANKFIWLALLICAGLILLVYAIPQTRLVLGLVALPGRVWAISILASILPLLLTSVAKRFT